MLPPLWNEIIDLYPPPMPVGYPPLLGKSMGGGERAPVALCREPTEPAGETGVGFTQGDPPAQGLATRKRAGALFTALRAGMTMLLPSLVAAAPLLKAARRRLALRKLFEKSLTKNFYLALPGPVGQIPSSAGAASVIFWISWRDASFVAPLPER